jgi:ssDNA-binding Zn-finger/Zn-ribbon topoisomerase 1
MYTVVCPKCKKTVDIDAKPIRKEYFGNELKVECPKCGANFLLQLVRIKHYLIQPEEEQQVVQIRAY